MKTNFLSISLLSNYSNYVKSRNGVFEPLLDMRSSNDVRTPLALSSNHCLIDVSISAPAPSSVEKSENFDVRSTDLETSKMILVSKVADLKSLHSTTSNQWTEFDSSLRTSTHLTVQKSASQDLASSQAETHQTGFIPKIEHWKVIVLDPANNRSKVKPERTEWSCGTIATPTKCHSGDVMGLGLTWKVN